MKSVTDSVAAVGLAVGGIFGMAGTMVARQDLRAAAWAFDSVAVVVATSLMALRYFRKGSDFVAAGFLVFAIGEGVMLSGTAATLAASVPSFAAGTALWSAALLLTGIPKEFAGWIRLVSVVGAGLFAATSARIFWGEQILPVTSPLPFFAYPLLVLAFAGWIWTLLKSA